ncbi:MAG: murein biosynthesis integral membrane protein MurJ [Clostridia bacterium]|nr:murein biosynthesis integral membrane protein MurJ [Clostridia bacterium]
MSQAKTHNVRVATLIMMAGLLLSKLSGHLREILIVPMLGYGVVSDAFIIGFQIPDLFYQLLVGGAIGAAVTPSLSHALEKGEESKGWRSLSILINYAALAMLVAVLLGEILSPQLLAFYNSSKDPAITDLAVRVSRALFPQVFFMMLAALCIGILNAYRQFGRTSFGPSVYNIVVVLAMVLLGERSANGAVRVAAGVMGAAAVYFMFQAVMAGPLLKNYTWSLDHQDPGFRQMVHLAVPTLISGSIVQVNTIILTGFADQFPGAATSLRNAATTWQLPYGIFVVAIGNVMLPSLARHHAAQDETSSSQLFSQSLRQALFLMIPSAALVLAMQEDVIRAIFKWSSSYSAEQVTTAASVLRWYALAMIAQTFVFLTNQAFYARKMTRVALVNGLLTLILNPLLCLVLLKGFRMDISGLSLAYTLTSIVSAIFLFRTYAYVAPRATPHHLSGYLLRLMAAASAMMVLLLFLNRVGYVPQGKIHELTWLFIRSALAMLVFLGVAVLLRLKEASNLLATVHTRFSAWLGLSKKRD